MQDSATHHSRPHQSGTSDLECDFRDSTLLAKSLPPPPDLTRHIVKTENQYSEGGSFADVYRCWYTDEDMESREVAVKAFRFSRYGREDMGDKLEKATRVVRRELGIWRRLDHCNVVPFLGIAHGFGAMGAVSLVSLWMPNDTLGKFLAKHEAKLNTGHRLRILLDIANGLQYLHSLPIVHGDLYPNNVLLDSNYTARLADFGYASLAGNMIPDSFAYLQRSTVAPGALRWNAPEQHGDAETSGLMTESDIYSFGCIGLQGRIVNQIVDNFLTLWQVLSGQEPWSEVRTLGRIMVLLLQGKNPARPQSRAIDDSHWDFLQLCWSPAQKRPAAEKLVTILEQFMKKSPPAGSIRDLFIPQSDQVHLPKKSDSRERSTKEPEKLGDSTMNSKRHDKAISSAKSSEPNNRHFESSPHRHPSIPHGGSSGDVYPENKPPINPMPHPIPKQVRPSLTTQPSQPRMAMTPAGGTVHEDTHGPDKTRSALPPNILVPRRQTKTQVTQRADNPPPYEVQRRYSPNVLVVGETGVGKSSVINLIAGQPFAAVHSGQGGCTMEAASYDIILQGDSGLDHHIRLFDTVGLNEPNFGRTDYLSAIEKANTLICQLQRTGGIRLLLFCIRGGRITAVMQNNYRLFCDILCQKQVPVAFVVTGLENETPMEGWWESNAELFEAYDLSSASHACVTATRGLNDCYAEKYLASQKAIRAMLLAHVTGSVTSFQPERTGWLIDLAGSLYRRISQIKNRRRQPVTAEELARHLQDECKFSRSEAEYLAAKIWAKRTESEGPDFVKDETSSVDSL